jgi:putative Mn2+ efflux pump MntP
LDAVSIFVIAVALGMDALSVAVGVGAALGSLTPGAVLRLAGSFGFFQFAMPLAGWLAGRTVAEHISRYDHWAAFLLLALVGGKMIWDALGHEKEKSREGAKERFPDPTRGLTLLVLSVATSIDAFAVGLSFAFIKAPILYASAVIGVICFLMTAAGMAFGRKLGKLFGRRAELIGGLVLIGIGAKILWDSMT